MNWKDRIFEIHEAYRFHKDVRKTAKFLNCSIGLVSEGLKLHDHWEEIRNFSTRIEALSHINSMKSIHETKLDSVLLRYNLVDCLHEFPENYFDLIIADGLYLTEENIEPLFNSLQNNSFAFFFSTKQHHELSGLIGSRFKLNSTNIIWVDESVYRDGRMLYECSELIIVAKKGNPKFRKGNPNLFHHNRVNPKMKLHYRERPVKLIESILNLVFSSPYKKVLDPFCRSSEVLKASRNLGHRYVGICKYEKEWSRVCRQMNVKES